MLSTPALPSNGDKVSLECKPEGSSPLLQGEHGSAVSVDEAGVSMTSATHTNEPCEKPTIVVPTHGGVSTVGSRRRESVGARLVCRGAIGCDVCSVGLVLVV